MEGNSREAHGGEVINRRQHGTRLAQEELPQVKGNSGGARGGEGNVGGTRRVWIAKIKYLKKVSTGDISPPW